MRPAEVAFVAVAILATGVASWFAFSPDLSGTLAFWALAGGPAVLVAVPALVWATREGFVKSWLMPRWGDLSRGIVGAAALFGLAWLFARAVAPAGSPRQVWLVSLYGQIGDPTVLQAHAPAVAFAIVVVSAAEELVWRGAVTQVFADRFGSRTAWLWAAGAYALAYVPTMWALRGGLGLNPVLVVAALGGGLFWGAMSRVFGTLVPVVVTHAFFDWAAIMMMPLWDSRLGSF
jgi:membrane protease YdiL (CAAX protease family)